MEQLKENSSGGEKRTAEQPRAVVEQLAPLRVGGKRTAVQLDLQPGEKRILELRISALATPSFYFFTFGLWEVWRRHQCLIVTNRRVVVSRGVIFSVQKSIPLDRIQSATTKTGGWGTVEITSAGDVESFGPTELQQARKAVEEILALSSQHRGDGLGGSHSNSNADELIKLADLRDRGALSDDEFVTQKAKLLE